MGDHRALCCARTGAENGSLNLLLVDDHALFREGMELLLRLLDPQMQVLHAASVTDALTVIGARSDIHLVLLDLHMPGLKGLAALHQFRQAHETLPCVVLSGSEELQIVWDAIDGGAMGFIQKQSDSRTMMTALRIVLDGGIYIPPVCLTGTGRRGAIPPPEPTARERIARLGVSERQMQVLAKMAHGKPNKVIARELGISEATVKTHLSACFDALEVHNRTEAVFTIARLGLRLQELEA